MAEAIVGPRAIVGIRRRLVEVSTKAWEPDYQRYFRRMAARTKAGPDPRALEAYYRGIVGGSAAKAELKTLLDRQYATMTKTVWEDVVSQQVGRAVAFDLNARGVEAVLGKVGTRVTQITEASQRLISERVASEIASTSNADKLESSLGDLLRSWGEDGGRAHIIALTESGNAYNQAATEGYRESGLVEQVQVYDGPDCGWTEHDDPDEADGSVRTLDEAEEYPLSHPHCQRAFGPVVLTEEPTVPDSPAEPDTTAPAEPDVPVEPPPEEPPLPDALTPGPSEPSGLPGEVDAHVNSMADLFAKGEAPPALEWESAGGMWRSYGTGDAVASRNLTEWGMWGAKQGIYDVEKALLRAEEILQKTADDAILSTRRSESSLHRILDEGRFKTQFETGTSAGSFDPTHRTAAERYMFGYADDLPVTQRPIYGYLRNKADDSFGAENYGDVLFDLNPSVRSRTTVVWTDSLGSTEQPSALTKVRASSINIKYHDPQAGRLGNPYTEAQMHGGLGIQDVQRVTLPYPPDSVLSGKLVRAGFHQGSDSTVWER